MRDATNSTPNTPHQPTLDDSVATGWPEGGPDRVSTSKMWRISLASGSGNLIEAFDFAVYGTAAALVFPKVFFPALGPAAGTVASFATFGVAFVARPFGSILFGHFGDRLGRKKSLVATLLLMGFATVLIGLLPTAAQIGVVAPILLVIARFLQGIAFGGEWAGAVLLAAESAPQARRGLWSTAPSIGATIGISLANLTFLVAGLGMSEEAFLTYGWRIPFVGSIVLVALGLFVRLRIEETPVFQKTKPQEGGVPFLEAFKHQPREVLLGSGVLLTVFVLFYMAISYLVNYGTTVAGLERNTVLWIAVVAGPVWAAGILIAAAYSDKVGRRRLLIIANAVGAVWALVLFPILGLGNTTVYAGAVWVTIFIAGLAFGPVTAYLPELFDTRYRYTAAGFSYNVAGVLGGAVPPLLAPIIITGLGAFALGVFVALLCAISAVCALVLKETRGNNLLNVGAN